DGEDDGLDAVDEGLAGRGVAVLHVGPGEGENDEDRGEDEGGATKPECGCPGAAGADVHRHLGRVRPGDEVRDAEVVEELLVGEPAALLDEFAAHDGEVRGGTTEGDEAQTEKVADDFGERTGGGA